MLSQFCVAPEFGFEMMPPLCPDMRPRLQVDAFTAFEQTFTAFGLPPAIRTDNRVPFASGHALYGLSKLSVWWLRPGIQIERSNAGTHNKTGATSACIYGEAGGHHAWLRERRAAAAARRCLCRALQSRAAASGRWT
jgi:hypothetical protein